MRKEALCSVTKAHDLHFKALKIRIVMISILGT